MQTVISDFFQQDHEKLDSLFFEFQRNRQDIEQAIILFSNFKTGLIKHINWEERLLFPSVEQAAGFTAHAGPTAVMRMEHMQIKDCLSLIEQSLRKSANTSQLETQLMAILASHNMKEENVLYPMSDQRIAADMAQDIVNQCKSSE